MVLQKYCDVIHLIGKSENSLYIKNHKNSSQRNNINGKRKELTMTQFVTKITGSKFKRHLFHEHFIKFKIY